MTGQKRFIVLEVQDQADAIKQCIEWIALSQPSLGLRDLKLRDATNILYFIARDLVDFQLSFKNPNPENAENIISILFGTPRNKISRVQHDMLKTLSTHSLWEGAVYTLRKQIEQYVELNTWVDWNVVKVGTLISLTEGEDHRVTEYHKESKALNEEDEALVTVNCKNPINFLYNRFKQRYSVNMHRLLAHCQDPDVQMDNYYRKVASDFFSDPTLFICGLFCDTMIRINPQIELGEPNAPKLNQVIIKLLDIHDMERFQSEEVSKLIMAFGLGWLGFDIKRDESYTLEYYTSTHVMAIFRKSYTTLTEKYEEELLRAFIRNDFLPEKDRLIAEKLYLERPHQVLNLSQ